MSSHKIICWNCDGFFSHHNDFKLLIQNYNPYICCFQETKFRFDQFPSVSNFDVYVKNCDSTTVAKGGVMTLVSNQFSSELININSNLEVVAVRVYFPIKFTVCNIYLRGRETLRLSDLDNIVEQLEHPFMIMGDANAHGLWWGSQHTDARGKILEDFVSKHQLFILNKGNPTHFSYSYRTFSSIDIVFCSPVLQSFFDWYVEDDLYNSDHFPIILPTFANHSDISIREKWLVKDANWTQYQINLDFSNNNDHGDIDSHVSNFNASINNAALSCIRKSKSQLRKKYVPWWNSEISSNIKEKKRLFRTFRRTLNSNDLKNFLVIKYKVKKMIRHAKQSCWITFIQKIDLRVPSSIVYKMIAKINGKSTFKQISSLYNGQNLITNRHEIIEILADYFSENSSDSNCSSDFLFHKMEIESRPLKIPDNSLESYNSDFTMEELKFALSECKGSSPGPDDIHYAMLKNLSIAGKILLLKLYNRIFKNHEFPSEWRKSFLIPILKNGKDPKNPRNYRPIALTNCICKVLEKMISKRLLWYLEHNNLLSPFQSGFRKRRCTLDNLSFLESSIMEAFADRKYLISVFFDIEKAYDRTWRRLVLETMIKYGFKGHIVHFVNNFLKDRSFQILLGNMKSSSRPLLNGLLQGSVISVVLFILVINDIFMKINPSIQSIMYCDDLCIFLKGNCLTDIQLKLQDALNSLQIWSTQTGFEFNAQKTVAMLFTRKYGIPNYPQLSLNSKIIEYVDNHCFLGATLDRKLRWDKHIKIIKAKAYRALNLLKILSNTNYGSSRETLLKILNIYVLPVLDYSSILYTSASKTTLNSLDSVLNSGIRLATGAYRTSPSESLLADAGFLPLKYRRQKQTLNFALKIISQSHPLSKKINNDFLFSTYSQRNTNYQPIYTRSRILLEKYNIPMKIDTKSEYLHPPWLIKNFRADLSMTKFKKNNTTNLIFQKLFHEIKHKYPTYNLLVRRIKQMYIEINP
jgi:hypothetical protein